MTLEQLMIQSALTNWKLTTQRAGKIIFELTDEQFYREIVPGKNRPIYLLGHLTAIHDAMLSLLGLGARKHPELDRIFISNPDKATEDLPPIDDLKRYWSEVSEALSEGFQTLSATQWMQRHTAMTDEDYSRDPTRNRFTVLLNRTNHAGYHLGQLILARG
jgi:hypothetical protein